MRSGIYRELAVLIAAGTLWACGGTTAAEPDTGPVGSSGSLSGSIDGGRVPTNHRTSDAACQSAEPPGNCPIHGSTSSGECQNDDNCTTGSNGRCVQEGSGPPRCVCTYDTCTQDTDCATGGTCACHGSPYGGFMDNTCVASNCRIDTDCGAGGYCSPAESTISCGGLLGYYCHTPDDRCLDDTDCTSTGNGPQVCTYSTTANRWQCDAEGVCP